MGKEIRWELYKKLKFNYTNIWYVHKIVWDFEEQTDNLNSHRRPDLVFVNEKENLLNSWLCRSSWLQGKNERKRKERWVRRRYKGSEKTVERESDSDTNFNWCTIYSYQRIDKGIGGFVKMRTSVEHPNYCIIEIDQNTKKSHGNLRRLVLTQTLVGDHQLTPMWKALKENNTKQRKKILLTTGRWHENIPTNGCKRNRTILD